MTQKLKKIEYFTVEVRNMEGKLSDLLFEDLLDEIKILNKEIDFKGKHLSFKILSREDDYLTGIVETSRTDNLPPKKSRSRSSISKIGLTADEGLVYGNIFLYQKEKKLLLFEVNRNGCYLDHFISFINLLHENNGTGKRFKLKFNILLTKNEYARILDFKMFKSVEVEVARPDRIIENMTRKNGPLFNIAHTALDLGSSKMVAKFEVEGRKPASGLIDKSIREVMKDINELFTTRSSDDIKKVEIKGYEGDIKKIKNIDMVADKFIAYIKLDEPRENIDLLEMTRKNEIIRVYNDSLRDIEAILK